MIKLTKVSILMFALGFSLLSACSGGGGGGGGGSPQTATAVLTLASAVKGTIPAGTIITGYDVTLNLPSGVTVKSASPPQTDDGVVVASAQGAGSSIVSVYTAATGTTPGKVRLLIVNANGINPGEFSKVTCDVVAGLNLVPSDFTEPSFAATGIDTSTSTVDLTAELALTATAVIH